MPIFKFTTQKPSSLKIWTTLIDTPIHPREGYTEDQIRYRMFVWLQLTSDFKTVIGLCNNIIDSDTVLLITLLNGSCAAAGCKESDFSDLDVLSLSFPNWVSPELYTPYYLTKQLCHKINSFELLGQLTGRDMTIGAELLHINIDNGVNEGLTAYKLYNSMHMDEMLPYVTISYDRTPTVVEDITNIRMTIRDQLIQSIEVSDNYIIPENAKTTIPYFVLKSDTTVPQTRSSSSNRTFVVGDRVRLRSDLVNKDEYGRMTFHEGMRFVGITTISELSSSGNFQLIDHSFLYSPEMLEHAE